MALPKEIGTVKMSLNIRIYPNKHQADPNGAQILTVALMNRKLPEVQEMKHSGQM